MHVVTHTHLFLHPIPNVYKFVVHNDSIYATPPYLSYTCFIYIISFYFPVLRIMLREEIEKE